MSDLINREDVIKCLQENGWLDDTNIDELIETIPTAYSVDKAVNQLEDYGNEEIGYYRGTPYENCIRECVSKAIEIVKQGGVSDDVCEWYKVKNCNAYKCNTHAEIHDSRVLDWCVCPYCGKKIKIVGD